MSRSNTCGNCKWFGLLPFARKWGECRAEHVKRKLRVRGWVGYPVEFHCDYTCPHYEPKQEAK